MLLLLLLLGCCCLRTYTSLPVKPTPSPPPRHVFIFGLGYTDLALASDLLARYPGAACVVSGTCRTDDKVAALAALGIDAHVFDTDESEAAATTTTARRTARRNTTSDGPWLARWQLVAGPGGFTAVLLLRPCCRDNSRRREDCCLLLRPQRRRLSTRRHRIPTTTRRRRASTGSTAASSSTWPHSPRSCSSSASTATTRTCISPTSARRAATRRSTPRPTRSTSMTPASTSPSRASPASSWQCAATRRVRLDQHRQRVADTENSAPARQGGGHRRERPVCVGVRPRRGPVLAQPPTHLGWAGNPVADSVELKRLEDTLDLHLLSLSDIHFGQVCRRPFSAASRPCTTRLLTTRIVCVCSAPWPPRTGTATSRCAIRSSYRCAVMFPTS
jgi:hypothetical protein